jgi:cytochrome P450
MDRPHASILESVGFTLFGLVPNVLQGLFWRRERVVAIASRLGVDRLAVGVVGRLRDRYGPGPVWVRVARDRALLLLSIDDVRRVLEGSPDPFAPDPDAKRRGMSHFQPHALTLSRGEAWENRRRFTEAVLDTGKPLHRLADRFLAVAREESGELLQEADAAGRLEWTPFHRGLHRITRRIVLGDRAREDEQVSDQLATLMAEANKLPKERSEHFDPFMAKLGEYVAAAEPNSLVGLFDEAPSDPRTEVEGQIPHWMFAMADTLATNAFRALALIASHPRQGARLQEELSAAQSSGALDTAQGVAGLAYLEGCLEEAMRLWPTTPLLSRETSTEVSWDGASVPSGTQILISNTFNHRDRARHDFADRFAPEAWVDGEADEDWSFNHFSHGPQGCPGAGLALFVGKAVLAELLTQRQVRLLEPSLNPDRPLPQMLDFFRLRFAVEPKP